MTRILVTGGTGLIGEHAVTSLAGSAAEVHVLSRRAPANPAAHVTYHAVNLLDTSTTAALVKQLRPTHLLHLAWVTEHGKYWHAPDNLDWLAAALHLARTFADAGGQRLVGAGTCAEYDWTDESLIRSNCSEHRTRARPNTLYGRAKNACHEVLAAFADQSGLSMAWGRVFFLFDPKEDRRRLIASIIASLGADRRAACSPGTQVRDFMAAEDVGAAFAALTLSDVRGPVNLASGVAMSVAEIARMIGRLMQKPELIGLGDLPMRADDPPRLVADVDRLTRDVGFTPPFSLEERLSQCINNMVGSPTKTPLA